MTSTSAHEAGGAAPVDRSSLAADVADRRATVIVPAASLHLPNLVGVAVLHIVGLGLAPITYSPGALAAMLVLLFLTACVGWSVGLHRLIIHQSFECPRWVRYVLAYIGTLAGIGGPLLTYQSHNGRDYYQNLVEGPDVSGYRRGFFSAYLALLLRRPYPSEARPVPDDVANDRFFRFLDRTNLFQQLPIAVLLYLLGGWSYVVWGVFLRIALLFDLFASVNYFCHTTGYQAFRIRGCTDEGRNNVVLGYLGMGEGWHNNHHAYPTSARIGLRWWEVDAGYAVIRVLAALRLAWSVRTPANTPLRVHAEPIARPREA
jgi:stearoyl-CoA desaturase (delta-9 desaturase)